MIAVIKIYTREAGAVGWIVVKLDCMAWRRIGSFWETSREIDVALWRRQADVLKLIGVRAYVLHTRHRTLVLAAYRFARDWANHCHSRFLAGCHLPPLAQKLAEALFKQNPIAMFEYFVPRILQNLFFNAFLGKVDFLKCLASRFECKMYLGC